MMRDAVLGFIADIGLDAVKDHIKDVAMEAAARKRLIEFLERQHKLNFQCTIEEEIDFEGLFNYIRNDLLEDIKLRFFGDKEERDNAHKTIIAKASYYAQTKTRISKQRATKIVSSSISLLRDYYKSKTNRELAFYAGCVEDAVIDKMSDQHSQLSREIEGVKKDVSSSALLSLDHNMQLAKDGQFDKVGANLSSVIKAVSTTHPLYPYYGFSMKNTNGEMISIPLLKEAVTKYPPRFDITTCHVRIGSNDISEIQSDDFLKYSYRHQLPITLDDATVIKLLGNTPDPIQEEAKEMQRGKIILVPPKFPEAFPCSISLNGITAFDYLLMRIKEIMEDGTILATNEEQKNRSFDVLFSINQNSKTMNFNIRPLTASNAEQLKYHRFMKTASKGGTVAIKALSLNSLLGVGNINPFAPSQGLDLEVEFLEKITEIEQHFGIALTIPEKIRLEDHQTIDHIYSIIHAGHFSAHWSTFNTEFEINENFKINIAKAEDILYMLMYTCVGNVELFDQGFSFPMKRELRSARFKDLKRLQEKAEVLDAGDKITVSFISDDTNGDNTYIDTFADENDIPSEK